MAKRLVMRKPRAKTMQQDISPGDWTGEFISPGSLTYGQMEQPGPPVHIVEFTYLVAPAFMRSPKKQEWGGVVMIMPPPKGEPLSAAGFVLSDGPLPTLTLSLSATRVQFSDLIRHMGDREISEFRFSLAANGQGKWTVSSWHMIANIRGHRDGRAP